MLLVIEQAVMILSSKKTNWSGANTPIQEKTGSCMEARLKGPSAFVAPGGKNKWLSKKVSRRSK